MHLNFLLLVLSFFSFSENTFANIERQTKKYKYKTFFGSCPSRTAGSLTLELMGDFEKNKSLRSIKNKIINEKLDEKHFVSEYRVNLDPFKKHLTFSYDCPEPLLKVQIFEKDGKGSYTAILVENGDLVDPTYEVLLRQENKLKQNLADLAVPVGEMKTGLQKRLARLFKTFDRTLSKSLSEVIVSDDLTMTLIFSFKGRPSSVFLGDRQWRSKLVKLTKTLKYLRRKKKIPAVINLTNSKKIVVKFNDKF